MSDDDLTLCKFRVQPAGFTGNPTGINNRYKLREFKLRIGGEEVCSVRCPQRTVG